MRSQERRKAPRIPLNRAVLAHLPNQDTIFGTTTDISEDGIGFYTQQSLPKGTPLKIHLEVPDKTQHFHPFELEGNISHCVDTHENGFHIGVHLAQAPEEFKTFIAHLEPRH